jgi:DNA repair protein SbcC/Rad50
VNMKITSLELTNITSFRGHHVIDFDKILGKNDLFSITGNMGSGKSTILNAISMALFGKSYKSQYQSSDIVTTSEAEGHIKLKFQHKDQSYMAAWKLKKTKKTGEPISRPTPVRRLYQNDIIIEMTAEKLLGLSFQQFSKAVIIHQGEFANFISSSFTERKAILENLYQGENLSQLSKILQRKIRCYNDQKDKIQWKKDQTRKIDRSTHERHLLKQDLNSKYQEEAKSIIKSLTHQIKVGEQISCEKMALEKIQVTLSEATSSNTLLLKELTPLANKLEHSKKENETLQNELKVKRPKIISLIQKNDQLSQLEKQSHSDNQVFLQKKSALESYKVNEEKMINEMEGIKRSMKDLITISPTLLQEDLEMAFELLQNLQVVKNEIAQTENLFQETDFQIQKLKDESREFKIVSQQKDREKVSLEKLNLNMIQKIQLRLKPLENLALAQDLKIHLQTCQMRKSQKSCRELQQFLLSKKEALRQLQEKKDKQSIHLEDLLKQQNHQEKIVSQENQEAILICRNLAKTTENCPICFSKNNESREIYQTAINSYQQSIQAIMIELDILKPEDVDHLMALITDVEEQTEALETNLQKISALKLELEQFLKKNLQDRDVKINELLQKSHTLKTKSDLSKNQYKTATGQFYTYLQLKETDVLPFNKCSQLFITEFKDLQQKKSQLSSIKLSCEHNKDFQKHLTFELTTLNNQIKERSLITQSLKSDLTSDSLGQFIQDPKQELERLQVELETKSNEYQQLFENVQGKKLSLEKNELVINLNKNEREKRALALEGLLSENILLENNSQVLISPYPQNDSESQYTYQSSKDQFVSLLEITREKAHYYQSAIDRYKQEHRALKKIQAILQKIEKKIIQLQKLEVVLGRDEFRNYALSLIEKELIKFTNFELQHLCQGRYQILPVDKTIGQEFYIVDYIPSMTLRKVSTLSGGETFQISLAMASALSELCMGQSQIESFFIDEGFGSLDPQGLEDVKRTLESMGKRGKKIGIITHIYDFAEQFPANIHLKRDNQGETSVTHH